MDDYPTDNAGILNSPERACALVNKFSGERQSAMFVQAQLKKHFGERNVFDLFPEAKKPPAIEEAKEFVARHNPDLLVIAGGDGTVSLGFDIVDALRAAKRIDAGAAPIAVVPMGTGNDLSRSLGFGGGYSIPVMKAEEHFTKVLNRIKTARAKKVDRFSITIELMEPQSGGVRPHRINSEMETSARRYQHHPFLSPVEYSPVFSLQEVRGPSRNESRGANDDVAPASATAADSVKRGGGVPMRKGDAAPQMVATAAPPPFTRVFTNYFSIGFDAKVAERFDDFRSNNPKMCSSRIANKVWYGCFGCQALCTTNPIPRSRVRLLLNGEERKIPSGIKAIVIANMLTYAGGNVLWQDSQKRFSRPEVDDGKVEVSALEGVWHMVGVGTQTRAAQKIGQASTITLYAPAHLTMQYDGEPIAAMGSKNQMVKISIQFHSRSLAMQLKKRRGKEEEEVTPLHGEETG